MDQPDFEFRDFSTQIGLQTLQKDRDDREFTLIGLSRYEGTDAMKTANDLVEQNESVSEEGVVDAAITVQLENCLRIIILEVKTQSESLDPDQLAKTRNDSLVCTTCSADCPAGQCGTTLKTPRNA